MTKTSYAIFKLSDKHVAAWEKRALTRRPGPTCIGGGSQKRWTSVWQIENIFQCSPSI